MAAPVARLQALECKICLEPYAEDGGEQTPMSLICGHSLCRKCLTEIWEQGGRLRVRCPFDRRAHSVENLSDVPRNLPLIEAITELRERAGEPAPPPARAPTPAPQDQPRVWSPSDFEARRWGWNFEIEDRGMNREQPQNNIGVARSGESRRREAPAPAPQHFQRDPAPPPAHPPQPFMSLLQQFARLERDPRLRQLHNNNDAGRSEESGGRREQAGEPAPPPAPQHFQRDIPLNRVLNAPNQPIQQPPTAAQHYNVLLELWSTRPRATPLLEREAGLHELLGDIRLDSLQHDVEDGSSGGP